MRRKLPFVPQMEAVECGAACLTMVLRSYGRFVELSSVREACGVSRDGVSAKQLVRVARQHGLQTRARRLEPKDLEGLEHPAVIHWEMNHFVLLERWTPDEARVLDPAVGPRRIRAAEFARSFTGICIELWPGEGFVEQPERRASRARYAEMLSAARPALWVVGGTSLILSVLGLTIPLATQLIVDEVLLGRQAGWLGVMGAGAFGLTLLALAALWLRSWVVSRVRDHVDSAMSAEMVGHILSLPIRFFEQRHTADLVARIDGVRVLREVLAERAVSLLVDGPLLLVYLAILLALEWRLGLVVLASALAYGAVYAVVRPFQLAALRERIVKDVRAAGQLLQTLRGVVTLKSSGRELAAHDRWLRLFAHTLNAAAVESRVRIRGAAALLAVRLLGPAAVLAWGAVLTVEGRLTTGELLGFLLLSGAFLVPLESALQALLRVQELPLVLSRMDDVLETRPEEGGSRPCPTLSGDIRFEDVTFRYGPTAPPSLDQVSFTIRRGEKVALVGPSGSGKSTLAKLLLGLYRPESGTIAFDDHDLGDLDLDSVRRQLGAVLQETVLFDGSIRENIALYHPTASIDDVVTAARVAQLHADIEALPLGYETRISGTGGPLSGGQRQRLALARAVLHRPPILLLDEATSALDTATEAAVGAYLASRICTRVVIAHRLSTIRDADRILVLDGGRVVEQGRHHELVASGGLYARLVALGDTVPKTVATEPRDEGPSAGDLGAYPALADLGDDDRAALARAMTRKVISEESVLVHRGDRGQGLFFVQSGALDVVLEEPGLAKHKLGSVGAGTMLGEVSVLDGSPVSATLIATERTVVLHLPMREVERLRAEGDVLAVRLTLSLGRLLAQRLRAKTDERARVGQAGGGDAPTVEAAAGSAPLVLDVADTGLGASLTAAELRHLHAMGEKRTFAKGQELFRAGDPSDGCHLVLGGRVAVRLADVEGALNVVRPGEILGEVALFDPGPRTATCVAEEQTVTFHLAHADLLKMLSSGDAVASKVLRHLVHGLVRVFRISELRLREAIAQSSGEADHARRAREEARELAASRDLVLTGPEAGSGIGLVQSDVARSGAACLTALLRHSGRPAPLSTVWEACSDAGSLTAASFERGARSFGVSARRLGLEPEELDHLDSPLIVELEGKGYAVAERWRGRRLLVKSPCEGRLELDRATLAARFTGAAFEVRAADPPRASLRERLIAEFGVRRRALASVLVAAFGLQLASLAVPIGISLLVGRAIPAADVGLIGVVAVGLGAFAAAQILSSLHRSWAILHLRTHLDASLFGQLLRHVLSLRIDFFERRPVASLLARFEAFRIVRELIGEQGLGLLLDLPMLVVVLVAMLLLDGPLASVVLVATLVVAVVLGWVLPRLRRLASVELEASSTQRGRLLEVLSAVVTLRAVGAREAGVRRWLPAQRRSLSAVSRQEILVGACFALTDFARVGAVVIATWWGAARVLEGSLALGTLMAFTSLAAAYLLALRDLGVYLGALSRAVARGSLLAETFSEAPEQSATHLLPPGHVRGRVTLESVSFGYDADSGDVLHDVSLDVEPGTKVALVGATGSGKSTLGKLLLGFYLPRSGRVLLDGKDLTSLDLTAVRAQLGVVLQDAQLFSGTVRENISITAPDAPVERVVESAKLADIHGVVADLPMGYDTIVSEGGSSFSGGQRQRLALARALVHEPAVLLLDEATSALDNASQGRIEASLARLGCTRIVIAHRLSTVIDADQVIVLDRGRVVETGTHADLMAAKGYYFRLAQAQLA